MTAGKRLKIRQWNAARHGEIANLRTVKKNALFRFLPELCQSVLVTLMIFPRKILRVRLTAG